MLSCGIIDSLGMCERLLVFHTVSIALLVLYRYHKTCI